MNRKFSFLIRTSFFGLLAAFMQSASSAELFIDDFETALGNWSNVTSGDNKDWTRDSGGTPSIGTGPASGANGSAYYVYLETSSGAAYAAGDTAILLSPIITGSSIHLTFQYHMYGSSTGTLAVDVFDGSVWINDAWYISGQQHFSNSDTYTSVEVDLSSYTVVQLRLRATAAGGYTGDIAIDNVEITSVPTGPVAPVFNSDPVVKSDAIQDQHYSDSLSVDANDANGDSLIFSKISGPAWLTVATDGQLSGTPSSINVGNNIFVVEVSDGALSSTATVNVNVNDDSTPLVIATDDFETGLGNWSNVTLGDNKDWTRDSGGTPSIGTGPANGANGSSYYMYVETSSGGAYTTGDTAILESSLIVGGSNIHLKFKYHMYGSNTGTLAVDVFDGLVWINDVWSIFGQQHISNSEDYTSVDVDLSSYTVAQLRLRVTADGGYTGDISVDNLEITGSGSISTGGVTLAKVVFATSQGYTGNLGGLAGADAICQSEANAAGLSGTFKAFLSDNNTSAAARLDHSTIPYELVNGTPIAADWADLVDGRIDNALNVTASGSTVSFYAWTGSDADGTKATYYLSDYPYGYSLDLTCDNWSMNTDSFHYLGARGSVNDLRAWSDWWQGDGSPCSSSLRLYCIEQ